MAAPTYAKRKIVELTKIMVSNARPEFNNLKAEVIGKVGRVQWERILKKAGWQVMKEEKNGKT